MLGRSVLVTWKETTMRTLDEILAISAERKGGEAVIFAEYTPSKPPTALAAMTFAAYATSILEVAPSAWLERAPQALPDVTVAT